MSRKSQKRTIYNPRKVELIRQYWRTYYAWKDREPSKWRIISWLKWRDERPEMPKWMQEYSEMTKNIC
jgi:hypothetical protein